MSCLFDIRCDKPENGLIGARVDKFVHRESYKEISQQQEIKEQIMQMGCQIRNRYPMKNK